MAVSEPHFESPLLCRLRVLVDCHEELGGVQFCMSSHHFSFADLKAFPLRLARDQETPLAAKWLFNDCLSSLARCYQ